MYKIIEKGFTQRLSDGARIPPVPGNRDYDQILEDIKEQGIGIIEGADIIELDYTALRTGPDGYLSLAEQMDVLTKDGLEALQAMNNAVKTKYPKTIQGGKSIAALPNWVITGGSE